MADWDATAERSRKHKERQEAVRAQMKERAALALEHRRIAGLVAGLETGGQRRMRERALPTGHRRGHPPGSHRQTGRVQTRLRAMIARRPAASLSLPRAASE